MSKVRSDVTQMSTIEKSDDNNQLIISSANDINNYYFYKLINNTDDICQPVINRNVCRLISGRLTVFSIKLICESESGKFLEQGSPHQRLWPGPFPVTRPWNRKCCLESEPESAKFPWQLHLSTTDTHAKNIYEHQTMTSSQTVIFTRDNKGQKYQLRLLW